MKTRLVLLTLACLLVAAPATAQVNYAVSGSTAYVASSPNASGAIVIASTYNGYPVTSIGDYAFSGYSYRGCTNLTSVTIPNSVTRIGYDAFMNCTKATNFTFLGNAPQLIFHPSNFFTGRWFFNVGAGAKAYYYCGTIGWGTNYEIGRAHV